MTRNVKGSIKLEPGTAPTASKGVTYFDSTANKFKISEDGITFTNLVGGVLTNVWELVEEREITGSASTTEDFTSLDGDVDGAYVIDYFLVHELGSTVDYAVRLNGSSMTGNRQFMEGNGTSVSSGRDTSNTLTSVVATSSSSGTIRLPKTKTGNTRHILHRTARKESTIIAVDIINMYISTPVNSTNITSIGIGAGTASGIGIGSVLRLWKRKA